MAQTITTQEWTQITGLDSTKTYILQAQMASAQKTIQVNWFQGENIPSSKERKILTDTLKVKALSNIYVKTEATPIIIAVQEVI